MGSITEVFADVISYARSQKIQVVRITGTKRATLFEGVDNAKNCRICMRAVARQIFDQLIGRFGIEDLNLLKKLIETNKKMNGTAYYTYCRFFNPPLLDGLRFETEYGKSKYYFLRDKLPQILVEKEDAIKWNFTFVPEEILIEGFRKAARVHAKLERNFVIRSADGKLFFEIEAEDDYGLPVSSAKFCMAHGLTCDLNPPVHWQCSTFFKIIWTARKCKKLVSISNMGVIQIYVDTGLVKYEFVLPGFKS